MLSLSLLPAEIIYDIGRHVHNPLGYANEGERLECGGPFTVSLERDQNVRSLAAFASTCTRVRQVLLPLLLSRASVSYARDMDEVLALDFKQYIKTLEVHIHPSDCNEMYALPQKITALLAELPIKHLSIDLCENSTLMWALVMSQLLATFPSSGPRHIFYRLQSLSIKVNFRYSSGIGLVNPLMVLMPLFTHAVSLNFLAINCWVENDSFPYIDVLDALPSQTKLHTLRLGGQLQETIDELLSSNALRRQDKLETLTWCTSKRFEVQDATKPFEELLSSHRSLRVIQLNTRPTYEEAQSMSRASATLQALFYTPWAQRLRPRAGAHEELWDLGWGFWRRNPEEEKEPRIVPLRRGDMAALDAGLIDYHPKPPPLPPRQRTRSAHVD